MLFLESIGAAFLQDIIGIAQISGIADKAELDGRFVNWLIILIMPSCPGASPSRQSRISQFSLLNKVI
jgi:hypothetical protein